jgi:hypothetical protein
LNCVAGKASSLMKPFCSLIKHKQDNTLWGELEGKRKKNNFIKWRKKEGKTRGQQKSVWSGKMFGSRGIPLKAGCIVQDFDGFQLLYIALIEMVCLLVSNFYYFFLLCEYKINRRSQMAPLDR